MKNIYLQFLDLHSDNADMALATVTRTTGSAPQKPGSSALFGNKGLIAGTVGGGVVEGRVEKMAKESIISKKSGHFRFNLSNDISIKKRQFAEDRSASLLMPNRTTIYLFSNNSEDRLKAEYLVF